MSGRYEVTIRDCETVRVFDEDTEDLMFRLRRSIQLAERKKQTDREAREAGMVVFDFAPDRSEPAELSEGPQCEVCHVVLGIGPGKCKPAHDRPSYCFECAILFDEP